MALCLIIMSVFLLYACKKSDENGSTYIITFDSNGGSSVQSIVVSGKEKITFPPSPTLDDHTFLGWFFDNNTFLKQLKEDTFLSSPISANTTVYAKWLHDSEVPVDPNNPGPGIPDPVFLVVFESNGGSAINSYMGTEIAEEPLPKRAERLFLGWYENIELTGNRIVFPFAIGKNRQLFAKWSGDKTYERENDRIIMGEYPQGVVTSADLLLELDKLTPENGYVTYLGNRYLKAQPAQNIKSGTTFNDRTTAVTASKYYYFLVEPISWTVVSDTMGRATIISEFVLDTMQFDPEESSWDGSRAREFLSGKFLSSAFSDTSSGSIILKNNASTTDKVYLLSQTDANKLSKTGARQGTPTDYAIAMGADIKVGTNNEGKCAWWLMTENTASSQEVKAVLADGSIANAGVSNSATGIRPCLSIDYYYIADFSGIRVKGFYGEKIKIPTADYEEGQTFYGWYNNPQLSGTALSGTTVKLIGDINFYADIQ